VVFKHFVLCQKLVFEMMEACSCSAAVLHILMEGFGSWNQTLPQKDVQVDASEVMGSSCPR
jgi:hypothetical protein